MTEAGWTTQKPQQAGLYHTRKRGESEGQIIEVVPPDKYRLPSGGELQDLPSEGDEYKVVDGYASSS